MIAVRDALLSLRPGSEWNLLGGTDITWLDENTVVPTEEEIADEIIRLQAIDDAQEYARLRKAKYDLLNQDEMRYDDLINSTTTWQDAIAAIKLAHPKPS